MLVFGNGASEFKWLSNWKVSEALFPRTNIFGGFPGHTAIWGLAYFLYYYDCKCFECACMFCVYLYCTILYVVLPWMA